MRCNRYFQSNGNYTSGKKHYKTPASFVSRVALANMKHPLGICHGFGNKYAIPMYVFWDFINNIGVVFSIHVCAVLSKFQNEDISGEREREIERVMKCWVKDLSVIVLLWLIWCIFEAMSADVFKDGHPVAHEHFPSIVSLQEWGDKWEHICVGNVVDKRNVLTACQCVGRVHNNTVDPKDLTKLRVYAGAGDLDRGTAVELYIKVRNFTAHPRVSSSTYGPVAFDLALLHLAQELQFNVEISPMNLPMEDTTVHSKVFCYSPGWGSSYEQNPSKNLTLVEYRRIPRTQCYNILCRLFSLCSVNLRKHEQTCAFNSKFRSCFTDLGSPLVCHGSIYGMATFKDGPNSPVVFTGLKPILEMVHMSAKYPPKMTNDTEESRRAFEDRKKLETWVRMLSSSQVYQTTKITLISLGFLLALTV